MKIATLQVFPTLYPSRLQTIVSLQCCIVLFCPFYEPYLRLKSKNKANTLALLIELVYELLLKGCFALVCHIFISYT